MVHMHSEEKKDIVRGRLNKGDNTSTSEAKENLSSLTHMDAISKDVYILTFMFSLLYLYKYEDLYIYSVQNMATFLER